MKAAAPSIFTLIRESTRKNSNLDAIRELLAEDPSLVNAVAPKKLADIRGMSPPSVCPLHRVARGHRLVPSGPRRRRQLPSGEKMVLGVPSGPL